MELELIPLIRVDTANLWLKRWVFTCNHGSIGLIYIIAGTIGGSLGTGFSFLMRAELSIPGYVLVQDNLHDYNVWITAHGILMIFFMVMPFMIGGLGNIIVPIQIGSPDMVFPRFNNLSFWLLPFSMVFLMMSMFIENGCGAGWTLYAPLSGWIGHPGTPVDLVIFSIHLVGISSIVGAINFIGTIGRMRWTIEPFDYWTKLPLLAIAVATGLKI